MSSRKLGYLESPSGRFLIGALVCVGALLGTGAAVAEGEVNVVGQQVQHRGNTLEMAVTTCLAAFADQLFPGRTFRVRTIALPDQGYLHHPSNMGPHIEVAMTAALQTSGKLIAQSQCRVSRSSQVERLQTQIKDRSLLAAAAPGDIRMAMVSR